MPDEKFISLNVVNVVAFVDKLIVHRAPFAIHNSPTRDALAKRSPQRREWKNKIQPYLNHCFALLIHQEAPNRCVLKRACTRSCTGKCTWDFNLCNTKPNEPRLFSTLNECTFCACRQGKYCAVLCIQSFRSIDTPNRGHYTGHWLWILLQIINFSISLLLLLFGWLLRSFGTVCYSPRLLDLVIIIDIESLLIICRADHGHATTLCKWAEMAKCRMFQKLFDMLMIYRRWVDDVSWEDCFFLEIEN